MTENELFTSVDPVIIYIDIINCISCSMLPYPTAIQSTTTYYYIIIALDSRYYIIIIYECYSRKK